MLRNIRKIIVKEQIKMPENGRKIIQKK